MSNDTLIRELLEAGVHFGHQTKRWNPKMKRFIFGSRSGIYLIDLEQSAQCLKAAGDFLEDVAGRGQLILFIGTKKQARIILTEEAQRVGMPYVVNRWLGGTLTNFQTIKHNIDRLHELRRQKTDGFFERISKKDAKRLEHQMIRLEENFGGLADMDRLPGCMVVVDTKREQIAVREANRLKIPIVAVCDTNADPDVVTFPIPGNDDAIRSVRLIIRHLAERIISGRDRFMSASTTQPDSTTAADSSAEASFDSPLSGSDTQQDAVTKPINEG